MVICIILIALGMVALTLFLIEKVRKYSLKAMLIKATASILFIAVASVARYFNGNSTFATFALIALGFGMLGDVFLDLKYVYPQDDAIFSYAGFIVFAIGHVLYITGMIMEFYVPSNPAYIILPFALGSVAGIVTLALEKPLKMNFGKMKLICFIYAFLLFSMFFMAGSLMILHEFKTVSLIMLTAGGALFAISDLILCMTYFAKNRERPIDIISNGVTYYLAQFIIAFSIYFIGVVI